MIFCKRFEQLCAEKNLRPQSKEILEMTGVSSPAISNWFQKNILPKAEVLVRIAMYFHVSIDYLLGLTDVRIPGAATGLDSSSRSNPNEYSNSNPLPLSSSSSLPFSSEDDLTEQEKLLLKMFRQSGAEGQFRIIHALMSTCQDLNTTSHSTP